MRETRSHPFRVIVYPKGVWDSETRLELRSGGSSNLDSFVEGDRSAGQGPRLPLTTIDSIARELALERVDTIKIDVERAEKKALPGARRTIQRWRPRLSFDADYVDPRNAVRTVLYISPGYSVRCGACLDAGTRIEPASLAFYWGEFGLRLKAHSCVIGTNSWNASPVFHNGHSLHATIGTLSSSRPGLVLGWPRQTSGSLALNLSATVGMVHFLAAS